jgi:hypothetical protein
MDRIQSRLIAYGRIESHSIAHTETARCVLWAHATASLAHNPSCSFAYAQEGKAGERQRGAERLAAGY